MELTDRIDLLTLQKSSGKFITILVNAGYVYRIEQYLKDINETHYDPKSFEVVILISENAELENRIKELQKLYEFEIKYAITPFAYSQGNSNSNHGLFKVSDSSTYFVIMTSDRFRFAIKGWDAYLRQYVGFVPDDMFFLRTTYAKFEKLPRKSLWRAFCINETWAVYSRKMLEVTEGFPETPHLASHDCGFEMLYYYIKKDKTDIMLRDIPIPLLSGNYVVSSEMADGQINTDAQGEATEAAVKLQEVQQEMRRKYAKLIHKDFPVTEYTEGRTKFCTRASYFFFGARTTFFDAEMVSHLKYQATRFKAYVHRQNNKITADIVKDAENKKILLKNAEGHVFFSESYAPEIFEVFRNRLAVRSSEFFDCHHFVIAFYPILSRRASLKMFKKLLYYTLKKRTPRDLSRAKYFAIPTLYILKLIFQAPDYDYQKCMETLNDLNIFEGLLFNDEFKKAYKEHFKFVGRLV